VENAAADVSGAITSSLSALATDIYAGMSGSTNVTANWALSYANPATGATVSVPTFSLAAEEIRLYVGFASLPGTTVGQASPGSFSASFSLSGFGSEVEAATDAMEAASNAAMPRGGPVSATLSGSLTLQSVTTPFALDAGFFLGSATFDSDPETVWHYDHTTAVAPGAADLYSVAVHEFLHAVGFGSIGAWDDLVSGTNWLGAEVISLLGTGVGVLHSDGAHIAAGLAGIPLVDGVFQTGNPQEAALDPSLTLGTRKYLTDLDLAFLRDIGWQTIPEPSATALLLAASALGAARRHRRGA
jgi:hypothetical protein